MTRRIATVVLLSLMASTAQAADRLSGAWTAGTGPSTQTFVFKTQPDGRFTGLVCGPCDDPGAVFRIEDGRMLDDQRATFTINYDVGGPLFRRLGAYRSKVTATRTGEAWSLEQRAPQGAPVAFTLRRVVPSYEGVPVRARP